MSRTCCHAVPQWGNYAQVFAAAPFGRWMINSFLIVAITIPGMIITGTMTAYAFARFDFVGKNVWFILLLGTMMIPSTVTLIPQYLLWFFLKMIDTYVPLTIGPGWVAAPLWSSCYASLFSASRAIWTKRRRLMAPILSKFCGRSSSR